MNRKLTLVLCLSLVLAFGAPVSATAPTNIEIGQKFVRTELYFGFDIPSGGQVSEADWLNFLETEVTPRFPDGFTVVTALGQYRETGGRIVREPSRMLIVVYPKRERRAAAKRLDEIRELYKTRFKQQSVMRVDSSATVGFE